MWAILSTFHGCLFSLGSFAELDILMLFMFVQGELHTVDFLLGHNAMPQCLQHKLGSIDMIAAYNSSWISRGIRGS